MKTPEMGAILAYGERAGRQGVAVVRASQTGPMTAGEVALVRRLAKLAQFAGIAAGFAIVVAALVLAAGGDWPAGLTFVVAGILIVLNFCVYVPWIFERIIRKRGVVAE
jgi:hypothetical protein